jgi:hypothetical protein
MIDLDRIEGGLGAAADRFAFVLCRLEPDPSRPGKSIKKPIHPRSLMPADAHDPVNQIDWPAAVLHTTARGPAERGQGYAPAIVLREGDGLFCIDIDDALGDDGQWSARATELCSQFPKAYREVSQSGTGLHIIGSGKAPPHACKNVAEGLELYTERRLIVLTGTHASGDISADCTPQLAALIDSLFPPSATTAAPAEWTDAPCPEWRGPTDDGELIERALASKSAAATFGDGANFRHLWEADTDALGKAWPKTGRPFDASSADMALARRLAFWTGRDCERIQRIMEMSALRREKWSREDYIRGTILRAVSQQREVFGGERSEATLPSARSVVAAAPMGSTVNIVNAASIRPEPINWQWGGWLAGGKLHILAGAPGTGKTTLALAFAAAISTGGQWPDGSTAPVGDVLIWSGEDDPVDSLVPRLIAAGADRHRVHFIQGVTDANGAPRPFDPAGDMPLLFKAAKEIPSVRLLVVDPVVSAVAGDSHKNAEVRRGLQPLVDLARDIGAAVLGISHFSKGTAGRDPTERVTGSLAFGALARVVLCTCRGLEGAPRRLVRAKSNIGPDGGGFEYNFFQTALPGHPGVVGQAVGWGGPLEGTAGALLGEAEGTAEEAEECSALEEAKRFVATLLANGPMAAANVKAHATEAGLAWKTITRAKTALRIDSKKSGMAGPWMWELPANL